MLNIKYPIIQGGMGNISNAILTAAVSEAGGLGTIGAGTMTPSEIEEIIKETLKLTKNPIAVNIALSVSPFVKEILSLIIKYNIPIVSLSAGNPAPFIAKLRVYNVKTISVVATVRQAMKAEAAGADVIVAEGYEAAGINSNYETTTLVLIPQIAQTVKIPVVAAGGIADGSGLAAALTIGASGVQMGTRFIATKEAPFHEKYKEMIMEANDHHTVIVGRSVGRIRRVLTTAYTEKILEREKKGLALDDYYHLTSEEFHRRGAIHGDYENGYMNSGQIAGLIKDIPTVQDLIDKMMSDAQLHLNRASKLL